MKYKLIRIVREDMSEEYPQYKNDTEQYKHIQRYVGCDDFKSFVIDENGYFWEASEFFLQNDIKEFEVK